MSLKDKIKEAMTTAMKAKDSERLTSIRNVWNAIRKKEIDDRKDLTDAEVEKVVMTLSKQVQESVDQARASGRADMLAETEKDAAVLKEFLPQMMPAEEVSNIIVKIVGELKAAGTLPAGNAGMGAVMKQAMAVIGARADGKSIQEAVRKALT